MKKKALLHILIILTCFTICSEELPSFFQASNWYTLGEEKNVYTNNTLDLENSAWSLPVYSKLIFLNGFYALGSPWSGIDSFGKYTVSGKTVKLFPELEMFRWDEPYIISELHLTTSDRITENGSQLLIDSEDTIQFYGYEYPEKPSYVVLNKIPCTPVHIPIRLLKNNYLYALPTENSKNLFDPTNYYGNKATSAYASIIYIPIDENIDWVKVSIDFSNSEPVDGGGPFYSGWIRRGCFSEVINHSMLIISDNLRLRSKPSLEDDSEIVRLLRKWSIVKIVEIGSFVDRISEIESKWYKVQLDDGTQGWIFGGYAKQFDSEDELNELKAKYRNF